MYCVIDFVGLVSPSPPKKIIIKIKQAGLSRATLEISPDFSSNFPLRTHKSTSIKGCFNFKDLLNIVWTSTLKFKI